MTEHKSREERVAQTVRVVDELEPCTIQDVADYIGCSYASATNYLLDARQNGLIDRRRPPSPGRGVEAYRHSVANGAMDEIPSPDGEDTEPPEPADPDDVTDDGCGECGAGPGAITVNIRVGRGFGSGPVRVLTCGECEAESETNMTHQKSAEGDRFET